MKATVPIPDGIDPKVHAAYQTQLAHLYACDRCRREAPCEEGRRVRRALSAARAAAPPPTNSRRTISGE